jgi:hypothetical protein
VPKPLRLLSVVGFVVVAAFLVGFTAVKLAITPPTVTAATTPGQANLTLQTVGSIGFGPHPLWVSYLVQDGSGKWIHSTIWKLPAHSTIHVTIWQYDSPGPLRNFVWGGVTGVNGGAEYANGVRTTLSNPDGNNAPGHTFTVPQLGINIPLIGATATAKTPLCSLAPCTPSDPHVKITFSFQTGAAGLFRWQCFVPCALGYLDGNGGPMGTVGYMGGFLDVVNA